ARTGDPAYARSFDDWPATLADIESGKIGLEAPAALADRWVSQGVLLLNSSLTLSRFKVEVDPHQSRGHLALWRPLIQKVLTHLAASGRAIVFIGFGDAAVANLRLAGVEEPEAPMAAVLRDHPARADAVLS
ncbi:uracil-DNA glycosylase, partial [Rhizobiaceae sp. 2RAB30]